MIGYTPFWNIEKEKKYCYKKILTRNVKERAKLGVFFSVFDTLKNTKLLSELYLRFKEMTSIPSALPQADKICYVRSKSLRVISLFKTLIKWHTLVLVVLPLELTTSPLLLYHLLQHHGEVYHGQNHQADQ